MKWPRILAALTCALPCLMAAPTALAAPPKASPLPVAEFPHGQPTAALDSALRGLLRDVVEVIPLRRELYIQDQPPWSAQPARLVTACSQDENCQYVLARQMEVLMAEAQRQASALATAGSGAEYHEQQGALAITAIDQLCNAASAAQKWLFHFCGNSLDTSYIAARIWFNIGRESLGLELQRNADGTNQLTRDWIHGADMPEDEKKQRLAAIDAARERGIPAYNELEALDDIDGARMQLLFALGKVANENPDDPGNALYMAQLARLSARLNDQANAVTLLQAIDGLGLTPDQANACDLRLARARADIALARSEHRTLDARPLLATLQQSRCGMLTATEEAALAALHGNDPARALEALELTLNHCRDNGPCYSARHQRLLDLQAIAARDVTRMARQAEAGMELLEAHVTTSRERDYLWALARGLSAAGKYAEKGRALLGKLDEVIGYGRADIMGQGARGSHQDLGRYDELKRDLVLAQCVAGTPVSPSAFEVLRGQRLFERLRRQRWARELASVDVPQARAERDANLAALAEYRRGIPAVAAEATPYERVLFSLLGELLDAAEQALNDRYLDAQANAADEKDGQHRAAYAGWGLRNLAFKDTLATGGWLGDADVLATDEAYLSFLRVPGGFLGALVSNRRSPDFFGDPFADPNAPPVNHFIPLSAAQERTLALWRDLLRTGGGVTRGKRGVVRSDAEHDVIVDAGGVVLQGVPVWRLVDGSYAALDSAPAGAVRVQKPSEISDSLFALLLEPFRRHFQDHARLIVSPDGALALLPFETLTRNGVPATEIVDIGYVQSLAIYDELRNRKPKDLDSRDAARKPSPTTRLLTVADPVYVEGVDPLEWQPLPGTRLESSRLASLFPASTRLLGADADRKRLLDLNARQSLRSYGLLHFATHGYTDAQRSALVLSNAAGSRDSYFTDEDVATLDLASSLALLSACDTGVGRVVSGDGVVGLPYAFFMAGNRNTLMSLWPVDDAGTAAFIPAYVERLRGGDDLVSALNDTKRAFARGEYGEALRDPRIWSAFVLYGVAEPLPAALTH